MKFEVRGLRGGVVEALTLEAATADDARDMARHQQMEVLSMRGLRVSWTRAKRCDLSLFSEELAELLDAGLSVVEAVDTPAHAPRTTEAAEIYRELSSCCGKRTPFQARSQRCRMASAVLCGAHPVGREDQRPARRSGALSR